MRCRSQPDFLKGRPSQVTDVWEVKLPQSTADMLRTTATKRRCSYSNITRYCAFRLAEKQNLNWRPIIVQARREVSRNGPHPQKKYRHMVCFYGQDIRLIKLAALALDISVSEFIRIALLLYLPKLVMDNHNRRHISDAELLWLGIKRWLNIPISALNNAQQPHIRRFLFSAFPPAHWWPPATLQLPAGAMRFFATA